MRLTQYCPFGKFTVVVKCVSCSVVSNSLQMHGSLSMGFSRPDYWSGLSFPSPGDLLNPGTEPTSPALAGELFTTEPPGKPAVCEVLH